MNKIWAVLFGLMIAGAANATVLTFEYNTEISGATSPAGPAPWLTAVFDDSNTAGTVTLTLTSSLSDPAGFYGSVLFNVDPALFSGVTATVPVGTMFSSSLDGLNGGAGTRFDLGFSWDANDFGFNNQIVIELSGIDLTANSFNFLDATNSYYTMAHAQGLNGILALDSGWISTGGGTANVPEPATLFLMGVGLLGLGFSKRRKA